jgi:hypothetical protein
MKSILVFLCIGSILLVAPAVEAIIVSVSDVSTYPGEEGITVSISVDDRGVEEIYGIDLILQYDPSVAEATEVSTSVLTSDWNIISGIGAPGKITVALYGISPLRSGRGTIAEISLDIDEAAIPQKVSTLNLIKAEFNEHPAEKINGGSLVIKAKLPEEEREAAEEVSVIEEIEEVEREYIAPAPIPRIVVHREPEEEALEFPMPEDIIDEEAQQPLEVAAIEQEPIKKPRFIVKEKKEELLLKARIEKKQPISLPATVTARELKRFLFWRVYKLQLEDKQIRPFFWQIKDKQRLPFLLRLNKRKGTIYGIVWGKQDIALDFVIIVQNRERITANCKLEIK